MNHVNVLFDGYSNDLGDGRMDANCTCTLITGQKNIIIDTMTAWDREKLLNALTVRNIPPQNINYVICTHSHSDHTGNNNLFINAEHIVGNCVQNGTIFRELKFKKKYKICQGIELVPTPGHTHDDITVFVDSEIDGEHACIAITGDLFEKEADINNPSIWKELGRPELERTQAKHRSEVISKSHYIVPGHGPMFKVTDHMIQLLSEQIVNYCQK